MAYDEATAERVRRILARTAPVSERKMMGALVFMVHGRMCCGVNGNVLMIRTGPDAYARTLTRPHARAMDIGGRRMRGFVRVDPEGFQTDSALARWIRQGIKIASIATDSRPAVRKGPKVRSIS